MIRTGIRSANSLFRPSLNGNRDLLRALLRDGVRNGIFEVSVSKPREPAIASVAAGGGDRVLAYPLLCVCIYASAILVHNSRASRCGSFCTCHPVLIIIVARLAVV